MSLRLRLTLLVAALTTLVVGLVGAGLYVAFDRQQYDRVDTRLREQVTQLQHRPGPTPSGRNPLQLRSRDAASFGYALDSSGGVAVPPPAGLPVIKPPLDAISAALHGTTTLTSADAGGETYRLAIAPAPTTSSSARVIVVGMSLRGVDEAVAPLRWMLAVATAASLLLGAALGWLIARQALRPVTRLSEAAERIGSGGELGRRLAAPHGTDEVAHLTGAFNASLDRIESTYHELEELLDRQRRFVADASHELRTPLTTIRADIGMLDRYPDMDGEERAALVSRCRGEVERISRLAADLLDQARADAGALLSGPVRWEVLIGAVVEEVTRLAAPRAVSAQLAPLPTGSTDAAAVLRIASVIGENLARHTAPETTVRISAQRVGDSVVVVVEDDAQGAEPELLAHIFDRFVRGDPARSGPGSGLGLAIAHSLATALGGSLAAEPAVPSGLRLSLRLPIGAAAPAGEGTVALDSALSYEAGSATSAGA